MPTEHDATAHLNTSTHTHTHAATTGQTADQHHNETHDSRKHTGVGVHAYLNDATQTITSGTQVDLTMNAEVFDTNGFHDNSTNNNRITIPTGFGGIYLLNGGVMIASGATGRFIVGWKKNGSESGYLSESRVSAGTEYSVSAVCIASLAAGDYVTFYIFQDQGANRNIAGAQPGYSFGSAVLLGV